MNDTRTFDEFVRTNLGRQVRATFAFLNGDVIWEGELAETSGGSYRIGSNSFGPEALGMAVLWEVL